MTFPVDFHLLGRTIPAHPVFETVGYVAGFQTYLLLRRRGVARSPLADESIIWIIVGCVFGALVGSKLLAWLESPLDYWSHRNDANVWLGGKTIVGGLIGGWIGVVLMKKYLRIRTRTGDGFVFPLILGIAIGRIGCFLTGLPDHTYGIHTSLPWAVDFGDGPRHPTQLYEIAFLALLGLSLAVRRDHFRRPGQLWRAFAVCYFTWRLGVEFLKPRYTWPLVHLSAIQTASLLAAIVALWQMKQPDDQPVMQPDRASP